jgi:hypothetical protein
MTHFISDTYIEDRIAVGTLVLEGYHPVAEHVRTRLEITESVKDCAKFTRDFRALLGPLDSQPQASPD